MDATEIKSKIFYHFRIKCYNFMLNDCKEGVAKFKNDVSFRLYHSLALYLTNRTEEALHDLETVRNEHDVQLAATIALLYVHKVSGVANKEVFARLDAEMREQRKTSDAVDFYHAAFVLLVLNKPEKALDYAEKALAMQNDVSDFLTLKALLILTLNHHELKTVKSILEKSLKQNANDLNLILTYTECCLKLGDVPEALNTINKAVVRHQATVLPLLQKMKTHFADFDWEQTTETINRINAIENKTIETRKFRILTLLCKEDHPDFVCSELEKLAKQLENFEPRNIELCLNLCRLFSKISKSVTNETVKILEKLVQSYPDDVKAITELGYETFSIGNTKDARRFFKTASKIDATSFEALLGLSLCEFRENGTSEQLSDQIRFLLEFKNAETSEILYLLRARIARESRDAVTLLNTIAELKKTKLSGLFFSDEYLDLLHPDFLLEVTREYFRYVAYDNRVITDAEHLINLVVNACPGCAEAEFLLAKLQYSKGNVSGALNILERLVSGGRERASEVYLLTAKIQVENGLNERAGQILEVCVSNDFKAREEALYHYVAAMVEKNTGGFGDCLTSLKTALSLANERMSLEEKSEIYVQLIDTLNIVGQTEEASKILEEATQDLKGTPEEARILLLSAENLIQRQNIQEALDLLSKIQKIDSCFREAKIKTAEILLNHRRDKLAFLQVYLDFVQENPSVESLIMLGDAYMKVLEPDDALQCYEKALKQNPDDIFLTSKMGRALVETHYFTRAVTYYKEAVKNCGDRNLKLELAELYLNLKEYEKGELILLEELEKSNNENPDELQQLQYKARLLKLLAQLQEKSGNVTYAMKTLREAIDSLNRVKKRLTVEQNSVPKKELKNLVDMSKKLAEMAITCKSNEQAINYYKEGLVIAPDNVEILVALAKLYMQMNSLELCQQTCGNILRIDPENDTASLMMADIAFRKVDFDMASFHFTQLLAQQPTNWEALVRLIEISRRTGTIEDCLQHVTTAEKNCDNPHKQPGYLYALALYQWYSGNLNAALRNFNNARQDAHYGQMALCNMIEICLNPDEEMLDDQLMDTDDIEYRDSRSMALKTADRLLKELKQRLETQNDGLFKYRVLSNMRLLATKEKFNIEKALDDFITLASQPSYKENIAVTYGISSAYTLLKQGQRAKNQLKRVAKSNWTFEDAEHLERCWLLLAEYYVQSAKFDIASELVAKVIQHNKACTKAYEYLGFVSEKEQRYKEASNNYLQAWRFGGKNNPGVGFKLAYSLMKCKKYPDAIDVAQEVLKLSPDYPRVKKDVLDKCMNNLRI